jgi:hypothetical protein
LQLQATIERDAARDETARPKVAFRLWRELYVLKASQPRYLREHLISVKQEVETGLSYTAALTDTLGLTA